MRIATAVDADRDKARREIKGYASVAAGTVFSTVPREYFDDELYEDLTRMKAAYDYAQHGSNESEHSDLLTDRIFDAIAVACTPAEAIERFKALADMSIDGFVWPAGMTNPYPYNGNFRAGKSSPRWSVRSLTRKRVRHETHSPGIQGLRCT